MLTKYGKVYKQKREYTAARKAMAMLAEYLEKEKGVTQMDDVKDEDIKEYMDEQVEKARDEQDIKLSNFTKLTAKIVADVFEVDNFYWLFDLEQVPLEIYCPFDGERAIMVPDHFLHKVDRGTYRYVCPECGADVGVHKGSVIPLGTLADRDTKKARVKLHKLMSEYRDLNGYSESELYSELRELFHSENDVHVAWMNRQECQRGIRILKDELDRMKNEEK